MNQPRPYVSVLLVILSIGLLVGLGWDSYKLTSNGVSGNGFFSQWISIRALVTDGTSPYSSQVSALIDKTVKYENSFVVENLHGYTSPLYSGIIVLPFALVGDAPLARTLWVTAQLLAIFAMVVTSLRLSDWKSPWYIITLIALFSVFSFHVVIPWLDGSLAIWAGFFLCQAFLAMNNNHYELAGILFAIAAIQPQLILLVFIFVVLWAISQRRKILILWFFITLIFLSLLGLFLVPGWILQYLKLLYNYSANFAPGTLRMLFSSLWPGLGKQLAWLVTGILTIILVVEWWRALGKDFRWFLWTACLTMVVSQWIGIPTTPGNFTALILPAILVSAMLTVRWPHVGQWVAIVLALISFAWEWSLYYIDVTGINPRMQLNLLIPLPLVLLIGLYWIRWWVIKPKRLLIEELKLGGTY